METIVLPLAEMTNISCTVEEGEKGRGRQGGRRKREEGGSKRGRRRRGREVREMERGEGRRERVAEGRKDIVKKRRKENPWHSHNIIPAVVAIEIDFVLR